MEQPTPSGHALRQARLSWEQSRIDLGEAERKWRNGAYLECGYFSLQAAINALSAVCRLQGHFQLPNSSPEGLLALCEEADSRFQTLRETCRTLEETLEKDPFSQTPPTDEQEKSHARACLQGGKDVRKAVRSFLKDNRKRYFSP